MTLEILFEDDDIVVVNKPPGVTVHKGAGVKDTETLVDVLRAHAPEILGVGEDADRPGIVHRLDKDTSGVLVVAKNQETFRNLKDQFKNRQVEKHYLAIVDGRMKEPRGLITLPIGRMGILRAVEGKKTLAKVREAVTEYIVRRRFRDATLVELIPKTGRMHQLRVHLKAIGYPVVGDALYGSKKARAGAPRQMLHALSLEFSLGDRRFAFQADPPEDFEELLGKLREESQMNEEELVQY